MENKNKLKKNLPNVILAVFFIIGLCIFLYPSVSDFVNEWAQNWEVSQYESKVSELSYDIYDNLISEAQEYNKSLVGKNLLFNNENLENTNYKNILSVENSGIIGYLKIPKINVRLPIYHGTDASILQIGVGHLEGTSFPVSGESVHAVLSGHTGLPSSKLLTDLVELEVGDTFSIVILNQIYTYEVDQILVVEPDETDALEIIEGKQYATIVTCTPYGVNTHRLLVRGALIQNVINADIASEATVVDSTIIIPIIAIPLIIILFIIMINIRNKKNKRKEIEENEIEKNKKNSSN